MKMGKIKYKMVNVFSTVELTVFLPGFSTLGCIGPIEKRKWGHGEGEKAGHNDILLTITV